MCFAGCRQNVSLQEESGANRLSAKEKAAGWELLFDGSSSTGWRGITKETFPQNGWVIHSGELRSELLNGAESTNGGDIITLKEYGPDFELAWEWKMLTYGGNRADGAFKETGENKF